MNFVLTNIKVNFFFFQASKRLPNLLHSHFKIDLWRFSEFQLLSRYSFFFFAQLFDFVSFLGFVMLRPKVLVSYQFDLLFTLDLNHKRIGATGKINKWDCSCNLLFLHLTPRTVNFHLWSNYATTSQFNREKLISQCFISNERSTNLAQHR